jgi:hypothetical protein
MGLEAQVRRFFGEKHMSKGSAPRPIPDRQKFDENWDKIFGKKPSKDEKK